MERFYHIEWDGGTKSYKMLTRWRDYCDRVEKLTCGCARPCASFFIVIRSSLTGQLYSSLLPNFIDGRSFNLFFFSMLNTSVFIIFFLFFKKKKMLSENAIIISLLGYGKMGIKNCNYKGVFFWQHLKAFFPPLGECERSCFESDAYRFLEKTYYFYDSESN